VSTPDPDPAIAAADVAVAETAYRLQLAREAFEAGRQEGDRAGYRRAGAERDAAWNAAAVPIAHSGPAAAGLEARRWGPTGREHFADPRPGDFPGTRTVTQEPTRELEAEAG
jgi:hypothetical protein